VERREMKIKRKYNRTLSKGSLPGAEYRDPQLGDTPSVNTNNGNNSDLNSSIRRGTPLHYEREITNLYYRKSNPIQWMVLEKEFTPLTADNICPECGTDHSFRPNFEGFKTSIDIIPQLLQRKNNDSNKGKILEAAK
jgi:hypothetical protein